MDKKNKFTKRNEKYLRKSKVEGHYGIRTGFHENGFESPDKSIRKMRGKIASQIDISPNDKVVDVGCGFGDCLVWLAETKEVSGIGIDIALPQLEVARELSQKRGVSENLQFVEGDYHHLSSLIDVPVDIVWISEALMYSTRSQKLIEAVTDVINGNGQIVIADTFLRKDSLTEKQQDHLETIYKGDLAHFNHIDILQDTLTANGFSGITSIDITDKVKPEVNKVAKFAYLFFPIYYVLSKFGVVENQRVSSVQKQISIKKLIDQNVLSYYIISATYSRKRNGSDTE